MKNKVRQKLPKWFDGEVYETGDEVRNPFSGDTCLLTAEELSMYDLIKGAEMVLQMSVAMDNEACYDIVEKGCKWFRSVNPQAYMTLLD
jgi:hypothetical protein|tara:strand:+ start:741 stop:1007 length:267 start_codon:yes stop_codon:yes gene_type:complete